MDALRETALIERTGQVRALTKPARDSPPSGRGPICIGTWLALQQYARQRVHIRSAVKTSHFQGFL